MKFKERQLASGDYQYTTGQPVSRIEDGGNLIEESTTSAQCASRADMRKGIGIA